MKKCAIAIGVDKAGSLPLLNAAARGAADFAGWAQSQGYDTTLLTDGEGKPVLAHDIRAAIKKYVNEKTYSQLIVFFSGHGILKDGINEYWLLSDVTNDSNEAVNIPASKMLAHNTGIPHITFISDACRVPANSLLMAQVWGTVIFPNATPNATRPNIDMFFATSPGDPAWEVKDGEGDKVDYKGIFTHCMLQGLKGEVKEIITVVEQDQSKWLVVEPYELKKHLEKQVPLAAEAVKITLKQNPMIEVTSRPPTYLSQIGPAPKPTRGGITKGPVKTVTLTNHFDNDDFNINQLLNASGDEKIDVDIAAELNKLAGATGRESFETQTGFSIIGTAQFDIATNAGGFDKFEQDDYWHVRIHPTADTHTLLLITANGTSTPLAVLQGFIGHILVEDNRVVNVNYVPSLNSQRYDAYMVRNEEVAQRRATAALAARHGTFRISGDMYSIMGTASYLRNDKALDPTLGLYAAYAYAQAGKHEDTLSVFEYMKKEPEPVLFDVKLLATINDNKTANLQTAHTPFCPMLTQGWSYLAINEASFAQALQQWLPYLIPGLWTTFTPEGTALVLNALKTKI